MKKIAVILGATVFVCAMQAQVPVKKDVMQILDKVPPPPASVREAYPKLECGEESGSMKCTAAKMFESAEAALKDVQDAFKAQEKAGNPPLPPGVTPEMVKKSQDPELKKKMKGMSKEEKMKMAMEMMGSGAASPPVLEVDPPPVRSALEEWQKVYAGIQAEFERGVAEQKEEIKIQQADDKAHAEIGEWETAEIAKLPQISSGEMSAPDPAKVKAVRLKAVDRHVVAADKRLIQIQQSWSAALKRTRSRFTAFHQKFVAADYASASKNFSTLKMLADAQLMILTDVAGLEKRSRVAFEEAGRWLAIRKTIEKE